MMIKKEKVHCYKFLKKHTYTSNIAGLRAAINLHSNNAGYKGGAGEGNALMAELYL